MTLQSIKDEIHNIKVIELPFHSSGEDYEQLKTAIVRLENIVNEYKPPTCDSCDKYEVSCNIIHHIPNLFNENKIFGCNLHSDYERKEDENI